HRTRAQHGRVQGRGVARPGSAACVHEAPRRAARLQRRADSAHRRNRRGRVPRHPQVAARHVQIRAGLGPLGQAQPAARRARARAVQRRRDRDSAQI
ncbi:hypothetical protein IWW55_004329, partial [Coemansia sp. RSA 2706]